MCVCVCIYIYAPTNHPGFSAGPKKKKKRLEARSLQFVFLYQ